MEGDELYTRVKKHVAPDESQGWTVVLMDRATRFLWDMHCGALVPFRVTQSLFYIYAVF
jgi:hypothetical protein